MPLRHTGAEIRSQPHLGFDSSRSSAKTPCGVIGTTIGRILLILLFLCSQGRSVCFDQAGNSYFCAPTLFSSDDRHGDPCQCPCEDDDCEEHELRTDTVLVDSIKVPSEPFAILPFEYTVHFDLGIVTFFRGWTSGKPAVVDDHEPGHHLREALLSTVVLRL